jgi:hypothetical protein
MDAVVWNGGRAVGALTVRRCGYERLQLRCRGLRRCRGAGLGELWQADATKPIAIAVATNA